MGSKEDNFSKKSFARSLERKSMPMSTSSLRTRNMHKSKQTVKCGEFGTAESSIISNPAGGSTRNWSAWKLGTRQKIGRVQHFPLKDNAFDAISEDSFASLDSDHLNWVTDTHAPW